MNLQNARFDRGVEFVFPNTAISTMNAGDRRLIVSNLAAFHVRYGSIYDGIILGEYLGNLSNSGEELQLLDPVGEVVLEFDYLPTWYPAALGTGRSLEALTTDHTQFGLATAWRPSPAFGGSPGSLSPVVGTQPEGQILNPGQPLTLTVSATATPAPTFQWRKDGVPIQDATGATYAVASVTEVDQGVYDVVATNEGGSVASATANVFVNDPVIITTHPLSQAVNPGTLVSLSVVAEGTGPLTYQWRKGGQPIDAAIGTTLEITVSEADQGNYDVVVTNVVGPVASNAASVMVNDPVVITTHPLPQTVNPGTLVTLSVAADGTAPFTYQWRKGGQPIDGAVGPTLEITASESGEGGYDVVVTNAVGPMISNVANVIVNDPVLITTHPVSQTVGFGTLVSMSVAAEGTAPFTYQWRKGGTPIDGANEASFQIAEAAEGDEGNYDVVVGNVVGTQTSASATLTVTSLPIITVQPVSRAVNAGGSAEFNVVATGAGPITYQWKKNGQPIGGATSADYQIAAVTESDLGGYEVAVTNLDGTVNSTTAQLSFVSWPEVAGNYQGLFEGPDLSDPASDPRPGRITAKLTATGKLTGKLEYFGLKNAFSAKLDVNLRATVNLVRRGTTPVTLSIYLNGISKTLEVSASHPVGTGTYSSQALAPHIPVRPKTVPPARMGRYTVLLEPGAVVPTSLTAPGYLTVNVTKTGATTWLGKLPDSTIVRGSASLTPEDELAFYSALYVLKPPTAGNVAGPLAIGDTGVGGELGWRKPPQTTKNPLWKTGIAALLSAHGQKYVAPARGVQVIPQATFKLKLDGPIPNNTVERDVQLNLQNKFVFQLPNAEKLKLTYNRTTGGMTGSYFDSVLQKTRKLEGVIMQADQRAGGFFPGTDTAGTWDLWVP